LVCGARKEKKRKEDETKHDLLGKKYSKVKSGKERKKRSRSGSVSRVLCSSSFLMASQSTVPMVPGTILNVRVHNFMQYSDVSFKPGRNLNVIVGPNGAGKSTIVNAICLGLAGKTESLGRGKTAKEFLQTGKEEAEIEVMLHRSDHGTVRAWSVTRSWTKDNK
jgi:ATPase subunit of ABC transporter with duplicated ATPase domains